MKNYDTLTLKDINQLLKKSDYYFVIQNYFWENKKFKIKKIEYDRKTPHNTARTKWDNRGNFYLIYDDLVENISEGILYDEDKKGGQRFIYRELLRLAEEWKKVFYWSNCKWAKDGTACNF